VASPRDVAISISGTFDSAVAPGPKKPSRWSSVRSSFVPTAPTIEMESVFVVVALPHGVGTAPKRIWPPATSRTAVPPGLIVALMTW